MTALAFSLIVNLTFFATGCDEDDPPSLSVSEELLEFGSATASQSVNIASDGPWTASSNATWCRTSTTSGRGEQLMDVIVDNNNDGTSRSAVITITTTGANSRSAAIMVSQSAIGGTVIITPGDASLDSDGGTISFAIAANSTWSLISSSSWAVPTVSSGKGNAIVNVAVAANSSHVENRTAVIAVTSGSDTKRVIKEFTITQLSNRLPSITLGQNALAFSQNGSSLNEKHSVVLVSNISGTLHATSEFAWCKAEIGTENGIRYIYISPQGDNQSNSHRDAIVTVSGHVEGQLVSGQIKVTQAGVGSPDIQLLRNMVTVDNQQNDVEVGYILSSSAITVNVAKEEQNWIQGVSIDKANSKVKFTVAKNTQVESRTGTVTVTATLGDELLLYPITVVQDGIGEVKISVTPQVITLLPTASDASTITVTSATLFSEITAIVGNAADKWLTIGSIQNVAPDGNNSTASTIQLSAAANPYNTERTATVIIAMKYGTLTFVKTVSVTQSGLESPIITPMPSAMTVAYDATSATIEWIASGTGISVAAAAESCEWITSIVKGSGNQFKLALDKNTNETDRSATVNLYATRDGKTLVYPVTITQRGMGKVSLSVSPNPIMLQAAGDLTTGTGTVAATFNVIANHSDAKITNVVLYEGDATSWCTLTAGTTGSSEYQGTLTAGPNTTFYARTATITVTVEWGSVTEVQTFTITQNFWGGSIN